ncbi:hypothetical protein JYU23_00845, partial [bacterium AH-315-C07]|nr:hypothetical protein [bacterium AH-315-C07]
MKIPKWLIPMVAVISFTSINAFAQTIHFYEDFNSAGSQTPPTGWTLQVVAGDTTIDKWRFDNPASREFGKTYSSWPYAIFDDAYVNDT